MTRCDVIVVKMVDDVTCVLSCELLRSAVSGEVMDEESTCQTTQTHTDTHTR